MVDITFTEIKVDDNLAFIVNKRGEKPCLLHGIIRGVGFGSVLVEEASGAVHRLRHSKRSAQNGRLLNAVVLHSKSNNTGSIKDCVGNTISAGNTVAFMEVPSQSFSTALLTGTVEEASSDGVEILVKSSTFQKYMRKPNEVVVINTI